MKPLNKAAKQQANKRFAGIYGLSLMMVLLISYFLFSSPVRILKHDVKNFSALKARHDTLMTRLNAMSQKITHLSQKGTVNKISGTAIDSMDAGIEDDTRQLIADLKSLADKETIPQVKEEIDNYLAAYNAVLFYYQHKNDPGNNERNTTIAINTRQPTNNNETIDASSLNNELRNLQAEKLKLATENKRLQALLTAGDNNAIEKNWQSKLAETEKERDLYKNQVNTKLEDLSSRDRIIKDLKKEKEDLTAEINKKPEPVNNEDKSKLYQAVDKAIKKNKHSKKDVLMDFGNILRSLESSYPQRALLDKKLGEINKLAVENF